MNKEVSRDVRLPIDQNEASQRFNAYWDASLSKREFHGGSAESIAAYELTFWTYMNSNPEAQPFTLLENLPVIRVKT